MNQFDHIFKVQLTAIIAVALLFANVNNAIAQTTLSSENKEHDNSASVSLRAAYCASSGKNYTDYRIIRVLFNTIDNTTPTSETAAYHDYSTPYTTSVARGTTNNISVWIRSNYAELQYQRVWIDWNQNGVFDIATEEYNIGTIYKSIYALSGGASFPITVPATAVLGTTRMRISSNFYTPPSGPCQTGLDGETEDYGITVTGGVPSGNAYGIYAPGAVSGIVDCEISAIDGGGTPGCLVCSPTDAGYTNVDISTFSVITAANVSCINKNITLSTSAASPTWSGSSPISGSTASTTFQYTATGRKDVTLNSVIASTWTDDFESSSGWTFSGTTAGAIGAIPANCTGTCITGTAKSGSKVLYLKQCSNTSTSIAQISLNVGIGGGTFSGYYKIGAESTNDLFKYKIDGGSWNNLASGCQNMWTNFSFAVSAGTHIIYLEYITNGTTITNGSKVIIDDVQCTNVVVSSTTSSYTGFTNMMMTPPSSGSVTGSPNGCPSSYNYASSTAGTPGFTYAWSVSPSASVTISSPTSGATNIQFPDASQIYTITFTPSSECCGPLAAVTYTTTINSSAAVPTASATNSTPCIGGSTMLTITAPANATYGWYDAASGGNLLGTGATYPISSAASGVSTYYAEAVNVSGCASATRKVVTVTGTATAPPTVAATTQCGPGEATLNISSPIAGYIYTWYTGSCGGSQVQSNTGTSYTTYTSATTTYYVSATAPGCTPSTCTTVTATVTTLATTLTWTGTVSGANNWFSPANWGGCIPSCGSNVIIPLKTNNPDIGFNAAGGAACNSITIQSTATLTFSDEKAELSICGDFTQTGTLTTNNKGIVIFKGTSPQTFTKTGSGNLNDVVLNNTGATPKLTLSSDMTLGATGSFTFQSGIVVTGAKNLIISNTQSAAISGHKSTSYVLGNLRRYINKTTPTSYDFPVGHLTKFYQLANVNFTTAPASINYLTANFNTYAAIPTALGLSECFSIYNRSALDNGYWDISADTPNNNSGVYSMTLYNTNYSTGTTYSGFTVMSQHNGGIIWGLLNGDGSKGFCRPSPVTAVVRDGMKGFSKFGVAQALSVLPIELLSFDAVYNGKSTDVEWTTASEKNNDYFNVERSTDTRNFIVVGKIASKATEGNSSSQLSYLFNDMNLKAGTYYYRLNQIDFDGKHFYTQVAAVTIADEALKFSVTPNPTDGDAEVSFECISTEIADLKVFDTRGRLVLSKLMVSSKGMNRFFIDISNETRGMFYVVLQVGTKTYNAKLLKN